MGRAIELRSWIRTRLSLRGRFFVASGALILVICIGFNLSIHYIMELIEADELENILAEEMHEFASSFAQDPGSKPSVGKGYEGFILRRGQNADTLPPPLAALAPGLHTEVNFRGREQLVARQDIDGTRLILVRDTTRLDRLEHGAATIAWTGGSIAIFISIFLAVLLSNDVMRPVTQLAGDIRRLSPERRHMRLRQDFVDREMRIIAESFNRFLDALDRMRDREEAFTEDVSHEFRTPLAVIGSASELLLEEKALTDRGRTRVLRIRRAGTQMHRLIDALLFLARESGTRITQSCAMDEIVQVSYDTCSALAAAKGIVLHLQLVPVTVTTVPGMADCVVNNLLLNAIQHTNEGSVHVQLSSSGLAVEDTGSGMPPAELARIFERRYRGPHSRGLGLGLYIVRRICDRLGWALQVQSSPGSGTRFHIRFHSPQQKPEPQLTGSVS